MSPAQAPQDWTVDALCAQTDPEAFYPDDERWSLLAKRVCAGCPVVAQCLGYALITGESYGVWGGLTTVERQFVRTALIGATPPAGKSSASKRAA